MKEPIKQGDRAHIIEGALGTKGPNIGKAVTVGTCQGEHSQHGRIWRVHGEGLTTEYGAKGTELDCAAAWLRKIEPPPLASTTRAREATT
jgi:hypothetical protein